MKKLLVHPIFITGLALRFLLITFIEPVAVAHWYAPFLDLTATVATYDPWSIWITSQGSLIAFPYGYAMWLVFFPMVILCKSVGISVIIAHQLTILIADICLLLTLSHLLPHRRLFILLVYWLSPIVIIASYGLGFNDLIPALFLWLAIVFLKNTRFQAAGAFLAAAISAKLSMVLALPFFSIYLYNNRSLRSRIPKFLTGFLLSICVLGLPFFLSPAGAQMLVHNPEIGKIYQLSLPLTADVSIYLSPVVFSIIVYYSWRVRRLNFDLFQATTGMGFLAIVLMTTASPGWFVWCLPFLVLYQAMSGRVAVFLVSLFSLTYVFATLLVNSLDIISTSTPSFVEALRVAPQQASRSVSLLQTTMVAIGLILLFRIWREAISRNDFFRLSRKPFVVGIAGDSGAGKDTFSKALTGLFGEHSVVRLSGDDYHLWDRQKPMWQVMTRLNPMANDLEGLCNDLLLLTDGKSVLSRHYDECTGRVSKPIKTNSNDFIIVSGLHTLYLPILRETYNIRIYLDTDEGIRRHFIDTENQKLLSPDLSFSPLLHEHINSDSIRFIRPQSQYADLILSLQPIHTKILAGLDENHPLRMKLVVHTKNGFNELSLHRVLVGVCGLHVDVDVANDGSDVKMTIEGDVSSADVSMAAKMICPRVLDFLDVTPVWHDGMLGLMQLFALTHIGQSLTKQIYHENS